MNPKSLIIVSLVLVATSGCVRRRLTVRTSPPGASVYVDNQYIGTSPTATATTFYGTREIQAVRDGFRTERILRRFNPPWYQLPPIDFISDTLWPKKIRDERIVDITLVPQQVMSSEELAARANNLRIQAAQGVATPLPPPLALGSGALGTAALGTNALGSAGQPPAPIDPTFQAP